MAVAVASSSILRAAAARFARFFAVSAALALSGCLGTSAFDEINDTQPVGSAFAIALFKDYSFLARSFGTQSAPAGTAFDAGQSISLTEADNTISGLANAYAQKALAAGKGDEILPEGVSDSDADAENVRLELLRDLDQGRDKAPEDAARAQADFDCWVMNRRVDTLASASASCRRSVTASLAKLEHELNPEPVASPSPETTAAPTPTPVPAPSAAATPTPAATPAQSGQFTVTFGYRSAAVSPDQQDIVAEAIAAGRAGHQSHITVVGHSDAAEDSQKLSLRRAEAVQAALVQRGARADAIAASGVGKDDPAVQTADHVKEPQNRRVVITLVP